jgi:hypothetical protein
MSREYKGEYKEGYGGECERGHTGDAVVGVRFEAVDVEQFLDAFERARLAVEALGRESTVAAQAMERLSRANRAARQALRPSWLQRLFHGRGRSRGRAP